MQFVTFWINLNFRNTALFGPYAAMFVNRIYPEKYSKTSFMSPGKSWKTVFFSVCTNPGEPPGGNGRVASLYLLLMLAVAADAWVGWPLTRGICDCVFLWVCIRTLEEKRLELPTPNLVCIYSEVKNGKGWGCRIVKRVASIGVCVSIK